MIDWSFGLLSTDEQAAIRRASVFASPFTAEAAAEVAGFAPLTTTTVAHALASLAEHHLLVVVDGPSGTCYRMLETIRQYGAELMDRDGEQDDVGARHLRWCLDTATRLRSTRASAERFDEVADDLRAALRWASGRPAWHAEAHQLAVRLAELTYSRGKPSEAQERYEEAAALTADPAEAAEASPPGRRRGVGPARRQRGDPTLPSRGGRGAPGRRPTTRRPRADVRRRADHERTGHHVRAGDAW